jgi:hypothetical protein
VLARVSASVFAAERILSKAGYVTLDKDLCVERKQLVTGQISLLLGSFFLVLQILISHLRILLLTPRHDVAYGNARIPSLPHSPYDVYCRDSRLTSDSWSLSLLQSIRIAMFVPGSSTRALRTDPSISTDHYSSTLTPGCTFSLHKSFEGANSGLQSQNNKTSMHGHHESSSPPPATPDVLRARDSANIASHFLSSWS